MIEFYGEELDEADVFVGPVVNVAAVERFARAVAQARQEGTVLEGGERLQDGRLGRGHFVAPTIVRVPLSSSLFVEELRSEEHTSELQSRLHLVCRLLLEKKKNKH